jgi:hypothetical protein
MEANHIREIDLIALIESDLGTGQAAGGKWTKFDCPFCKHIRRDSKKYLLVTNGDEKRGSWFVCKFCNKRGDALAWMREYRRLSHLDALAALRIGSNPNVRYRNTIKATPTLN